MTDSDCGKKLGRPRSEASRLAIIEATVRLMETQPIRALAIEGIAREAGVGKPTIYRWWGCKCSLVMDAFFETNAPKAPFPCRDRIDEALAEHVHRVVKLLRDYPGRIIAEIIGEGQSNPEVLERFRVQFFSLILAPAREAIERAKREGAFDPTLDTDLALDLIYGPICYRLLVGHEPLSNDFAAELASRVIPSLARPKAT